MQNADKTPLSSVRGENGHAMPAGIHESIMSDADRLSVSHFRPVKLALAALFMCVIMVFAGCAGTTDKTGTAHTSSGTDKEYEWPTLTPEAGKEGDQKGSDDSAGTNEDDQLSGKNDNKAAETTDKPSETPENGYSLEQITENPAATQSGDSDSEGDADDPVPEKKEILLYINEVLPTNKLHIRHNGDYFDVIELYNASDEPVDLSDYCLSDSKKHLTDYPLPAVELAPGGYCLFFCTGDYHAQGEYDLGFRLSYFGEKIYLCDKEGNVIDTLQYPRLPQNVSIGRDGDSLKVYDIPTLGGPNSGGYERMSAIPAVDLEPGFYEGIQKVSFTTGGIIRYTLDGSTPDSSSQIWDGKPIVLTATCSLRAYAEEENCLPGFVATYDYFFNEPEYELDVLMLSVKEADFEKMSENYSSSKKYAANISLFSQGKAEFSYDCAVGIFGGTSRAYAKKSFQISFSTDFGPSKLKYKLFDGLDIDEFNALVLRSGSQDNEGPLMRDEFVSGVSTSLGVIDDVLVQAYRPVNLYINDRYWGIYYIREHIDENMVASHYGCDPDEVTIIKQMKTVRCGNDANEWLKLWEYVKNNKLKSDEAYEYIKSVADVRSVADYYIIQLWCGNIDMDNVYVCKAGGKWFYILYDLDLTLCRDVEGTTSRQIGKFNSGFYTFNALIYRLLENAEFRELFCERMAAIVSTVYSDENVLSYANRLAGMIYHDMEYNCARWHGVSDPSGKLSYSSFKSWKRNLESLRKRITGRGKLIVEDFIKSKKIEQELVDRYFSGIID